MSRHVRRKLSGEPQNENPVYCSVCVYYESVEEKQTKYIYGKTWTGDVTKHRCNAPANVKLEDTWLRREVSYKRSPKANNAKNNCKWFTSEKENAKSNEVTTNEVQTKPLASDERFYAAISQIYEVDGEEPFSDFGNIYKR